jgi:hypothetical protein
MTPGLQTYDLPQQGSYKTDQGAELSVVPLTQNNIPAISQANSQNLAQIQTLFQHQQSIYKLSAGDVLSIQLWAYPEITPPIQEKYDSIKNANIKNKEDRLNNIEDNFNIVVLAGGKVIEDFKWEYNLEEKIIEIEIKDLNQLPSPVVSIALYKLTKRCEKGILA